MQNVPLQTHLDTAPERLLELLAGRLRAEARSLPLGTRQIVAVGARGMARWIEQELARRYGICTGISFPLPARLIHEILDDKLPPGPVEAASPKLSDREQLRWRIVVELGQVFAAGRLAEAWQPVAGYVQGDDGRPDPGRLIRIAGEAARALDALQIHRPLHLDDDDFWSRRLSPHAGWLRELLRRLQPELAEGGFAAGMARLASAPAAEATTWPPSLHLFGLSTLPCSYLEILSTFAAQTGRQVHLYRMVPSLHWLQDQTRAALAGDGWQSSAIPFLIRNVQAARRMQGMLLDFEERGRLQGASREVVDEAGGNSVLGRLQRQLRAVEQGPETLGEPDASLRLHVVHSPLREMEVLRDELLEAIEQDGLRPRDILVLMPDVDAAVPWIQAVFGPLRDRLPISVADRPAQHAMPALAAFFALLDLLCGRLAASDVFALLGEEPLQQLFGIPADALPVLRDWIGAGGARWGYDAAERRRALTGDAPDAGELEIGDDFTLRFALDRWLLGWLRGDDDAAETGDWGRGPRVPLGEVTQHEPAFAGVLQFVHWLRDLRRQVAQPRPLAVRGDDTADSWADWAGAVLERLQPVLSLEENTAVTALRREIFRLATAAGRAGYTEAVSLKVFRDLLLERWSEGSPQSNFLAGGVTFATLTPLRGVPFRMIALCGFSEGTWPRRSRSGEFDLLREAEPAGDQELPLGAGSCRPWSLGDPDRRAEDRLAFLESVLLAHERLHLSWVGRDARDGSEIPPALVVSEFCEELDRLGGGAFHRALRVEHPVHAYTLAVSASGGKPGSPGQPAPVRAPRMAAAARAARVPVADRLVPPSIWDGSIDLAALTPPPGGELHVDTAQLISFWNDPVRAWLRSQRLASWTEDTRLSDQDPPGLGPLEEWHVRAVLLADHVRGENWLRRRLRGEGGLPPGRPGELLFGQLQERVRAVLAKLPGGRFPAARLPVERSWTGEELLDRLDGKLAAPLAERLRAYRSVRLSGPLPDLGRDPASGLWGVTPSDPTKTKYHWRYALQGVLASLSPDWGPGDGGIRVVGEKSGEPKVVTLKPLPADQAAQVAAWLVAGYMLGQAAPLPWSPEIAWAYLKAGENNPWSKARGETDLEPSDRKSQFELRPVWGHGDAGRLCETPRTDIASMRESRDPWFRFWAQVEGGLPSAETWIEVLGRPALHMLETEQGGKSSKRGGKNSGATP